MASGAIISLTLVVPRDSSVTAGETSGPEFLESSFLPPKSDGRFSFGIIQIV